MILLQLDYLVYCLDNCADDTLTETDQRPHLPWRAVGEVEGDGNKTGQLVVSTRSLSILTPMHIYTVCVTADLISNLCALIGGSK